MILKEIDLGDDALAIIEREFTGLYSGPPQISSIKGGQTAADDALRNLDITRYAEDRSEVLDLLANNFAFPNRTLTCQIYI